MAEGMAEILMGTVEIEGVGELYQHLHPWEILVGLVSLIAVTRTLRWLIVAENTRRFLAADLTAITRLRSVTSVRERAYFPLGLN